MKTKKRITELEETVAGLRKELSAVSAALSETRAVAKAAAELAAAVDDAVRTQLLPDDSAARRAKEQIDAFNCGIYNILTFGATEGRK